MINKGLHQGRFKENPLEEKYTAKWDYYNSVSDYQFGVLDYLLAKEINKPCGEVDDRDRMVAATVIQWLGSPVGQEFLKEI